MRSRLAQPSLRDQLLRHLVVPLFLLICACAAMSYELGKRYANQLHDESLVENANSVMALLQRYPEARSGITQQAQFLIQYDVDGAQYFDVNSALHGRAGGNFRAPADLVAPAPGGAAHLQFINAAKRLRVATVAFHPQHDPADTVTVTVGETLDDRAAWARQILLITLPALIVMVLGVGLLVSAGIRAGLRILEPLRERLRKQDGSLTGLPVDGVPIEVMPLAQTINALLDRLRESVRVQNRFIADAAHQLRTPLAGIALQSDRIARGAEDEREDAIVQMQRLSTRTSRIADQLLALARVQAAAAAPDDAIDLARHLPEMVAHRVSDALRVGIDLGYQDLRRPGEPSCVELGTDALESIVDNLVDNALRYGVAMVTVTLAGNASTCTVCVDDDGPGVAEAHLRQMGSRFFRVPGSPAGGSGLGLSIVAEIVDRARGWLEFGSSPAGGLRVSLSLPRVQPRKADETPAPDDGGPAATREPECNPMNSSSKAAPTASSSSTG